MDTGYNTWLEDFLKMTWREKNESAIQGNMKYFMDIMNTEPPNSLYSFKE